MKKIRLMKKISVFICIVTLLFGSVPSFAADYSLADKADASAVKYYILTDENTETETEDFSRPGNYRVRTTVHNYGESGAINSVLMAGVFDRETHELKNVNFAEKSIAAGETAELAADVSVSESGTAEVKGYILNSLAELIPQGNTPPAAPENVTITHVTNSTADITWDESCDDADAVMYYKVYRFDSDNPDGKYVGSTFGNVTEFKDVGIGHKTEVSYAVSAVDAPGAEGERSEKSAPAVTKGIARLYLGAAAARIADGEDKAALSDDDCPLLSANENIEAVHFISDDGEGNSADISAVGPMFEYTGGSTLGMSAVSFGQNMGRLLISIPEDSELLTELKNSENREMKVVINYFDGYNESPSYVKNIGRNAAALVRYAVGSDLSGASGATAGNSGKWKTAVCTIPLKENPMEKTYPDVFKDRVFSLANVNKSVRTVAGTDGKSGMMTVGSGMKNNPVYISGIDIACSDYVPRSAALDFDRSENTQLVEYKRGTGVHSEAARSVSDLNGETKNAVRLYGDSDSTNKLFTGVNKDYISPESSDLIIRITYLDNAEDLTGGEKLSVVYQNSSGKNSVRTIARKGSGLWKTAEIFIDDASLKNGLKYGASLQLGTYCTEENSWCVSSVEIINRKP